MESAVNGNASPAIDQGPFLRQEGRAPGREGFELGDAEVQRMRTTAYAVRRVRRAPNLEGTDWIAWMVRRLRAWR